MQAMTVHANAVMLSPVPRMQGIGWPACIVAPDDMAALLFALDHAIMAGLADGLQRAFDEE